MSTITEETVDPILESAQICLEQARITIEEGDMMKPRQKRKQKPPKMYEMSDTEPLPSIPKPMPLIDIDDRRRSVNLSLNNKNERIESLYEPCFLRRQCTCDWVPVRNRPTVSRIVFLAPDKDKGLCFCFPSFILFPFNLRLLHSCE